METLCLQEQSTIAGYQVESVKLTSDLLLQHILTQEYPGKCTTQRKLTKKPLWSFVKKMQKQVSYILTTKGQKVVDLTNMTMRTTDHFVLIPNNKTTTKLRDMLSQIPKNKNKMLEDPKAELDDLTQAMTQS